MGKINVAVSKLSEDLKLFNNRLTTCEDNVTDNTRKMDDLQVKGLELQKQNEDLMDSGHTHPSCIIGEFEEVPNGNII